MATAKASTAKKMTKAQVIADLAERTNLSKKEIAKVFEELALLVKKELGRRGPGEFVLPELALKLKVRDEKAQKNVKRRNPATGAEFFVDVPKRRKVKATPLKKLKEMVGATTPSQTAS